ncbi:ABC transporter permease subunit, partial [Candidatus Bipolaricaulota bacterium]|nr:ABC transporter permease subunit [Candidatus Bipolaricaulota bacterium]
MSFKSQLRRRGLNLVRRPERVWALIILAALILFVIIPLAYMAVNSFRFDSVGIRYVRGAKIGQPTLFYWARVLGSYLSRSIFWEPVLRSLGIAVVMTGIALPLGALFAWLVVRTDLPGKKFFNSVLIIPYILPSWTIGLAWLTLFKAQKFGGYPGLVHAIFGVDPPSWIAYGFLPIVISLGVHYVPYTFILLRSALSSVDARLEESAEI